LTLPSFCNKHACADATERLVWVLQRDILHAMTMPIVQLFNRASTLAYSALYTSKPEDLELAFSGDARSAFLWLQCFIGEEEIWCHTRGCPGMYFLFFDTLTAWRLLTISSMLDLPNSLHRVHYTFHTCVFPPFIDRSVITNLFVFTRRQSLFA